MKIKIGTDICSLARIAAAYEKYGMRFANRILTESEVRYVMSEPRHVIARLAGRFAAKEAASKALGTGWHELSWKEVEIDRLKSGEPQVVLHGRAVDIAARRGLKHWEVTVSHEREFATATVLAYSE